jgi:hypothetical protein
MVSIDTWSAVAGHPIDDSWVVMYVGGMLRSSSRWPRTVCTRFCSRVCVFCCADIHIYRRRCSPERSFLSTCSSRICGGILGCHRLRLRTAGPVSQIPVANDTSSRVLGTLRGSNKIRLAVVGFSKSIYYDSSFVTKVKGGYYRDSAHLFALTFGLAFLLSHPRHGFVVCCPLSFFLR